MGDEDEDEVKFGVSAATMPGESRRAMRAECRSCAAGVGGREERGERAHRIRQGNVSQRGCV